MTRVFQLRRYKSHLKLPSSCTIQWYRWFISYGRMCGCIRLVTSLQSWPSNMLYLHIFTVLCRCPSTLNFVCAVNRKQKRPSVTTEVRPSWALDPWNSHSEKVKILKKKTKHKINCIETVVRKSGSPREHEKDAADIVSFIFETT